MQDTFRFVAEYEGEVPGAAPQDCVTLLAPRPSDG